MKKRALGKLYKQLFYIPKHEKLRDKVFRCRMVLSLLSIVACLTMLVSSTFALFHMSISSNNSTIESAYYSVQIEDIDNNTYTCPLVSDDKHTFTIKAEGTASTGYCKIQVGDQTYYTEQIAQGTSLELTIQAAEGTVINFTPQWGTSSYFVSERTCGNVISHSTTPYGVYTVEPTARLADIAAYYGVAEEDIIIYNNLLAAAAVDEASENVVQLEPGTELKIPGVTGDVKPYAVPYATYIVEPTATLDAISAHYNVSVEDISRFNDMSNFGTGMSLKIPYADPEISDYMVPYVTYGIEANANLEDISEHYNVSVEDILAYNGITEIAEGLELKIPGVAQDIEPYKVPASEQTLISVHKSESIVEKNSQTLTSGEVLSGDGVTKKEPIIGVQSAGAAITTDTLTAKEPETEEEATEIQAGETKSLDVEDEPVTDSSAEKPGGTEEPDVTEKSGTTEEGSSDITEDTAEEQDDTTETESEAETGTDTTEKGEVKKEN